MKVFIADDSIVIRNIVKEILSAYSDIKISGEASNGQQAVSAVLELQPDIVIMDMDMPVMNGLEATCRITRASSIPVLMFTNNADPELPFRALERGAAEFLRKPDFADINRPAYIQRFVNILRSISTRYRGRIFYTPQQSQADCATIAQKAEKPPTDMAADPSQASGAAKPRHQSSRQLDESMASLSWEPVNAPPPEIVVVGASTGGPQAVARFLTALSRPLPVPILIVQHIETGFDRGYAEWLAEESGLPVRLARSGDKILPGHVFVSPTDFHLVVDHDSLRLDDGEKVLNQKPSVDVLFQSAARSFGRRVVAVLLTGMGTDGASGCVSVLAAGGITVVQDEATSLIFGMPKAAIERGGAKYILPLPAISRFVAEMLRGQA